MTDAQQFPASFRDPSGFLFERGGGLFRQINEVYRGQYEQLISSGLYSDLAQAGLLIPHEEVEEAPCYAAGAYKVVRPERVPFVSYPYEWCFSALKDAA